MPVLLEGKRGSSGLREKLVVWAVSPILHCLLSINLAASPCSGQPRKQEVVP